MTTARKATRRLLVLPLLALVTVLAGAFPSAAQAQDPGTGASASKECPGLVAAPGDTITCGFVVQNIGDFPATVTTLTETSPSPGGAVTNISCTVAGGAVIDEGDTLAPDTPCVGTFTITVPSAPEACNTLLIDRVDIKLLYSTGFPQPVTAGAFAEHTTLIHCPAEISITKDADALSKEGDSVNYQFVLTNDGDVAVNRVSVNDTLLGDISGSFPATLAAGASATVNLSRVVQPGDPDPLPNTVTAIYSSGSGLFASQDTATATDSTNLFQPSITISKSCAPDPVQVGQTLLCNIVITNTSSTDTPTLQAATIADTRSGNLLAANVNVVSTTCGTGAFVSGGSCTIVTSYVVTAADLPGPLTNSVTLSVSPTGFPNVLTVSASDTVAITPPVVPGGEGCTPGFWKQDQHFDSWTEPFDPTDSFDATFGVDVTLRVDGELVTNPTLLQALNAQGGGINALARHAVAALLNAASPDVASGYTTAQIIAIVQDAIAPGGLTIEEAHALLAAANEQGCPLS
jgi:hypothetical protein